uniref:Uncharacterized protein n=1 Tax=Octopus bimaculoides TaxID=37653 RepID=A0A0L8I339_OCTBM
MGSSPKRTSYFSNGFHLSWENYGPPGDESYLKTGCPRMVSMVRFIQNHQKP